MDNKKHYLVCKTLREYQELLENHNFVRTHQSHLINFPKISAYVKTVDTLPWTMVVRFQYQD
ncbi:LytTR family transcriptional regulator DNA-binding domain-containing protein [Pedobacter panaciterrae]